MGLVVSLNKALNKLSLNRRLLVGLHCTGQYFVERAALPRGLAKGVGFAKGCLAIACSTCDQSPISCESYGAVSSY